jgi:hypothetical protein
MKLRLRSRLQSLAQRRLQLQQIQQEMFLLHLPQRLRPQQRLHLQLLQRLAQLLEFLVLEIILLLQLREWEFRVRFLVLEIIPSLLHKAWVDLVHLAPVLLVVRVVRLVPVVLVAQVVLVVLQERVVRLVPVVPVAQVVLVVLQERVVQVLVAVLRVELRVLVALVVRAVVQVPVAVAVLAVEPLVLSVRVVLAVRARLVSQSVQSAKSLNSVLTPHHLVVRLFHAVTAPRCCAFVAVHRFRISQTRLIQLQVS